MGLASNGVSSVDKQTPGVDEPNKSGEFNLVSNSQQYEDSDGEEANHPGSKKIKPVDGLVLKTPIAFQKDSDLDMIPIRKEGMAVCEKCGAIGVKHSFYTKERRFCSQACAKSFNESPHMSSINSEKRLNLQPGQQPANRKVGQPVEDVHVFSNKKRLQLAKEASGLDKDKYGFDWVEMLTEPGFVTPPTSCFRHAPLCDTWNSDVSVGMKVEVENTDTRQTPNSNDCPQSYWVASVISLMGYKALLRYEGFGTDDTKDFWVNLAAEDVHPVGWCASKGKPLIPPRTIQDKYTEWREFLVKRLTGARSLPNQFHVRVIEACRSRFRIGMTLELIDRNHLSSVKVANIDMIIGRRLKLRYVDSLPDDAGFWCHEESSLIHPVGWAQSVGHHIDASPSYLERCVKKTFLPNDATSDLFNEMKQPSANGTLKFKEGMKLEAVDPLNLDNICVATVVKVLRHGYLMIRIDRQEDDAIDGMDPGVFCYHSSSACIAPPGFCEANAITLKPPDDYDGRFRWGDYLRQTKATPAPESLFGSRDEGMPQIRVGMRVEAADLMDPRLVCVATIAQIAGRLVRVHFDGWSDDFDQWMDSSSPEIYPVGWCELAGYRLETPVAPAVVVPAPKRGRKPGRGGRGKGRGGARNSARSLSSTPTTSNIVIKRERSPSADSTKTQVRSKAAKLNSVPLKKSQESPRSLRSRGGQNQAYPSPADEAPPSIHGQQQRLSRRKQENDEAELNQSSSNNESLKSRSVPLTQVAVPNSEDIGLTGEATDSSGKRIPRLIDVSAAHRREALSGVAPLEWNPQDVAQFLRVNDCAAYCDTFTKAVVDGRVLLSLNKDRLLQLTNMKLGPSVKIFDLINQLKSKVGSSTNTRQNSNN